VKTVIFQDRSSGNEKAQRRAIMEAAITSTVNHPNVVATFSYDIQPLTAHGSVTQGGMMVSPEFREQMASDWKLFIVQEYCNSGSLRQALDKRHFWDDVRRQPKMVRGGVGVGGEMGDSPPIGWVGLWGWGAVRSWCVSVRRFCMRRQQFKRNEIGARHGWGTR
jgi:hypothetical protein